MLDELLFWSIVLSLSSGNRKKLAWPVPGHKKITSKFGPRKHPVTGETDNHNGIDIPAPVGTPIVAPASGYVSLINFTSRGGNQLILTHKNDVLTGFAHLSGYNVQQGEKVNKGQIIAYVGNTGQSTGPHLHFTVRKGNNFLNPEKYF